MIRISSLFAPLVNLSRTCLTRLLAQWTNHAYFHYQTQCILKPTHFFDMQFLAIQMNSYLNFESLGIDLLYLWVRISRTKFCDSQFEKTLISSDQTKYFLDRLWTRQPDIDIFITNYDVYGLDYYKDGEFGWCRTERLG
jgi:hypothetical protein